MSGSARVRLRLRSRDSLALRQMPPLPVLPQLPLESSSAAADADVATHGSVGDGIIPVARRPPSFGGLPSMVVGAGRGFCYTPHLPSQRRTTLSHVELSMSSRSTGNLQGEDRINRIPHTALAAPTRSNAPVQLLSDVGDTQL